MAFCPHCGASLNDGAKFCRSCGAQVTGATQPQPQPQSQPQQQPQPQSQPQPAPASPAGSDYTTLGGWLLFFVVGYGLSALYGIWNAFKIIDAGHALGMLGMSRYAVWSALMVVIGIVADVLVVAIIVRRRPDFLRLFQIISIARAAVDLIFCIPLYMAISGLSSWYANRMILSYLFTAVGAGVSLVLMTMYFCKSERVRVYMGTTEYLNTALFKIGV